MTLLVNEIHIPGGYLSKGLIVLAADRRVTINGKFHSNRRKLFKIDHLNAGVGYFGLAQRSQTEFFSGWLPNFIKNSADAKSPEEFAHRLCDVLNKSVSKDLLKQYGSGFHVCGYNAANLPVLWFVRNIGGMDGAAYIDFHDSYTITEDFLSRDAKKYGFDGSSAKVNQGFIQYYVNGDVRAFHAIWKQLDPPIQALLSQPDFNQPKVVEDLEQIVKWKMGVIASFYKRFAKQKIIGTPIDVVILPPNK
jgi:hypothetical protein